ncbi:MAG: nuclear transport factor 2 family protein [Proteobacteria bacterium]|nr:nuclear transport factor 2 family protein [Pseudomonadota bacterium]
MALDDKDSIAAVLDQFHKAASEHDFEKYFSLMSSDSVFIGTDATERWDLAAFKAYVKPHFDKGHGWTYRPQQRNISLASGARLAWFDEILENPKYGSCRGSGVLTKDGKTWKISQYHLTIPIPNELVEPVVKLIQAEKSKAKGK